MFYAVTLFSALGIVKAVNAPHKVAGDAAGAFKADALADHFVVSFSHVDPR